MAGNIMVLNAKEVPTREERKTYQNSIKKIISTINAEKMVEILETIAQNENESSKNRISAASKLLDKVVPDLKSMEGTVLNVGMELNTEDKTFVIQQLLQRKRELAVANVLELPKGEQSSV